MKRKIVVLLAIIVSLMSGCGLQNVVSDSSQEDTTTTESQETEEIDETQIEIETEEESESETECTETVVEVEPADEDLVLIKDYIPDMFIDLKYATTDNFTGQVIYESTDAYLRYGTVKKLMQVQAELEPLGYKLLLWDGYRPVEAQFKLWEICPDSTYVANPNNGFSSHSRGNTVDITLVTKDGKPVEMPTGFDDFTKEADRDYSDVSQAAGENAQLLEDIMEEAGFRGYSGEWWHYTDTTDYPVVE